MKTLLAFGLGYSAAALAARLNGEGWAIMGTGRTSSSMTRIASAGYPPLLFDGRDDNPDVSDAIRTATHLLISVPPGEAGDPVLRHHGEDIAEAPHLEWIGYLSTIGVYGDHDGAWVDEATPPRPKSPRSKERLAAENAWRAHGGASNVPVQIFRLAGIYGPGRNQIERLLKGDRQRIDKPGQVFNRIHVDDIAQTLAAAIGKTRDGDPALIFDPIFNVTDDEPAPPQDVIAFAAGLLGMEPPPLIDFNDANLTAMAKSFYGENKRVRNARLKRDLGVTLRHPTYREGLRSLHAALKLGNSQSSE